MMYHATAAMTKPADSAISIPSMNVTSPSDRTAPSIGVIGYSGTVKSGSYSGVSTSRKTMSPTFMSAYTMRWSTLAAFASTSISLPNSAMKRMMSAPVTRIDRYGVA